MTHSAVGNISFAVIAVLYAAAWLLVTFGYCTPRSSAVASMAASGALTVWSAVYSTWYAMVLAIAAIAYFTWEWLRADDI